MLYVFIVALPASHLTAVGPGYRDRERAFSLSCILGSFHDCIFISSTATLQALEGSLVKNILFAYFCVFLPLEDMKCNIISESDINEQWGVKSAGKEAAPQPAVKTRRSTVAALNPSSYKGKLRDQPVTGRCLQQHGPKRVTSFCDQFLLADNRGIYLRCKFQ